MRTIILLFAIVATSSLAWGRQDPLVVTLSKDDRVCREVLDSYNKESRCKLNDYTCLLNWNENNEAMFRRRELTDFVNAFGYTSAAYSKLYKYKDRFTLVYTSQFQGDRHPRDEATWIVDSDRLFKTLSLDPKPTTTAEYIDQFRAGKVRERSGDANKEEFNALLQDGKKISNSWAYAYSYNSEDYFIERECQGFWAYGADYVCKRIISLHVYKIDDAMEFRKVCELARSVSRKIR